jgi:antimicrobial peptide system SdpB family protein
MLTRLGRLAERWASAPDPWTNVYGWARTILALATAGTLIFSAPTTLFHPSAGLANAPPICESKLAALGIFCALPLSLTGARWLAVVFLLVVASGWRPRLTGIVLWWVSFSLVNNAVLVDGGDQVTMILSFLLIPVTLTDGRPWHWQAPLDRPLTLGEKLRRLVARTCFALIAFQVAGIYLHAAVGKFAVEAWTDGTALYYWILHPSFGASPWLAAFLQPLLRNRIVVTLLTWSVLVLEYLLGAALFMTPRRRLLLLPFGLALHAGIIVIHGLVSFGSIMMAALLLFLHPVDRALGWLRIIPSRQPVEHQARLPSQDLEPSSQASSDSSPFSLKALTHGETTEVRHEEGVSSLHRSTPHLHLHAPDGVLHASQAGRQRRL